MKKKITISLESDGSNGDIDVSIALRRIADWYLLNKQDPEGNPLTGCIVYNREEAYFKREYRKHDCFLVERYKP